MARMYFSDRFRAPKTIHASSIVNLPPTSGVTGVELVCRFAGIDFNYHCRQRIIAGHLCTEPILKHFNWTHLPPSTRQSGYSDNDAQCCWVGWGQIHFGKTAFPLRCGSWVVTMTTVVTANGGMFIKHSHRRRVHLIGRASNAYL